MCNKGLQMNCNSTDKNVHMYCVYPAISKSQKQLPNCTEKSWNKCCSNNFQGVLFHVCTLCLLLALHESAAQWLLFVILYTRQNKANIYLS